VSLKLMPLTENPFGFVIVTVIVVVDTPPTGTLEGLNVFDIVRGSDCARSGGAHTTAMRITRNARRRSATIDRLLFDVRGV
jgi:hypothetical protein